MALAVLAWVAGASFMAYFLRYFMRRGNVIAVAVLFILIPQIFVRPLIFFAGLDAPFPYEYFGAPDWELIATVLVLSTIWIITFSVAHIVAKEPLAPLGHLLPQVYGSFSLQLLLFAAVFTSTVGAISTGMLVIGAGSVAQFMFEVKVGKELAGAYVIREISVVGAVFSALALLAYEKQRRLAFRRGSGIVWACGALLLFNLAFNFAWGNRYNIAMLVIATGIGWHLYIQRINLFRMLFLLLIAAALLQILKLFRAEAVETVLEREIQTGHSFWLNISTSLHFNQFDALMLALRDAGERFQFRSGKDFINGLLSWVPRTFYPEKETFHIGRWFRQIYEPNAVNGWPITTMGGWYVNFGSAGVPIGGVISGVVAAIFDSRYRNVRTSAWGALIAPALGLLMFDGGVGPGFVQSIFLLLAPIMLLSLALRMTKKGAKQSLSHR
jgi:oligosaccharide repeat unit polymerase